MHTGHSFHTSQAAFVSLVSVQVLRAARDQLNGTKYGIRSLLLDDSSPTTAAEACIGILRAQSHPHTACSHRSLWLSACRHAAVDVREGGWHDFAPSSHVIRQLAAVKGHEPIVSSRYRGVTPAQQRILTHSSPLARAWRRARAAQISKTSVLSSGTASGSESFERVL